AHAAAVKPWGEFLASYFEGIGGAIVPAFVDLEHQATTARTTDGSVLVTGTLSIASAPAVIDATLYVGRRQGSGDVTFFGESPGVVDTAARKATGTFNGTELTLVQGARSALAYCVITRNADGTELDTIPIAYFANDSAPSQNANLLVTYDASGHELGRV